MTGVQTCALPILAEGRSPQLLGGSLVGGAWIPFPQASWDEARPELGAGVSEVTGNDRAPFRTTWLATGMVFCHRTHGWGCGRAAELPGCRWGPGWGGGPPGRSRGREAGGAGDNLEALPMPVQAFDVDLCVLLRRDRKSTRLNSSH